MRRIRKDSPEKAAARLERFLANPPERISFERIAKRRSGAIRRGKPKGLLDECCEVQRWRCHYCRQNMTRKAGDEPGKVATIDHLLPVSRGGTNVRNNVVAACFACNQAKGSMIEEEFRESDTCRMAETRSGSGRSPGSPVPEGHSPNPILSGDSPNG